MNEQFQFKLDADIEALGAESEQHAMNFEILYAVLSLCRPRVSAITSAVLRPEVVHRGGLVYRAALGARLLVPSLPLAKRVASVTPPVSRTAMAIATPSGLNKVARQQALQDSYVINRFKDRMRLLQEVYRHRGVIYILYKDSDSETITPAIAASLAEIFDSGDQKLKDYITSKMKSVPGCPISQKSLDFILSSPRLRPYLFLAQQYSVLTTSDVLERFGVVPNHFMMSSVDALNGFLSSLHEL